MIGRQEVLSTLAATARGGRLTYFWNISDDQPRDEVRAVFLGLQCFETALPLGGTIDINRSEGIWEIQGTGRRLALDASLWDSLANPRLKTDFTPAEVQFALLPTALHEARRKIEIRRADDSLIMRF
ncbi:MAG: histidine phosphotransferase family protein [Yoonia sp.]|nr:histidine phosphotransferase family protein [Yoonia sp.]